MSDRTTSIDELQRNLNELVIEYTALTERNALLEAAVKDLTNKIYSFSGSTISYEDVIRTCEYWNEKL